jgi:hypothetical protein
MWVMKKMLRPWMMDEMMVRMSMWDENQARTIESAFVSFIVLILLNLSLLVCLKSAGHKNSFFSLISHFSTRYGFNTMLYVEQNDRCKKTRTGHGSLGGMFLKKFARSLDTSVFFVCYLFFLFLFSMEPENFTKTVMWNALECRCTID